jgi:hypothetical protein
MTPRRREEQTDEVAVVGDTEDTTVTLPVDTDDNDDPNADASGNSQDENPLENEAPDDWQKGEE